jgi:Recombination endonuclease VII
MATAKSKKRKKFHDLRKYWPLLTLKEAEAERQKMSDFQKGCCAICKRHESTFAKRLAVDHNHKTGRVRGLLCFRCNKFLVGRQTVESATMLLDYLLCYDLASQEIE